MKCLICGERKGKRECSRLSGEVCSLCCGQTRNIIECNSFCPHFAKESFELLQTKTIKLTQNGIGKVYRFSENLFLPNINDLLMMQIKNLEIIIKNPILVSIKMSFLILKKNSTKRDIQLDEAYVIDKWKRPNDNLYPFLQIYTLGNGECNNIKMINKSDRTNIDVSIENNHVDTWLPFSIIKREKPKKEEFSDDPTIDENIVSDIAYGKYFFGKNNTFLASLKLNNIYELSFDVQYNTIASDKENIIIPLSFLFPYSLINFENFDISLLEDYKFADKAAIQLLLPFEDKMILNFPKPLDNCKILSASGCISHKMKTIEKTFHYDNYCIFNNYLSLIANKETETNVYFNNLPIFLGIYDDFNKVYNNGYSPAKITIFNSSSKPKKYRIVATIQDLSHTYENEVYVDPCSVANYNISPLIKEDKIETISTTVKKDITVKVFEGDKQILAKNNKCTVYPKDIFVEKIENDRNDWEIDFRGFLCRWITPNDKSIDAIVSEIAKDGNVVSNTTTNTYDIEKEIKAVYDKLSNMNYAIRTVNFSEEKYHTQRISLPKTTIKYKSGNCIDLSILMASIFEALKLKTYICLIPGHAFVRVKVNEDQYCNIETTLLGKAEFSEAVESANKKYEEHFDGINSKDEGSFIVDVETSRNSKIFPME